MNVSIAMHVFQNVPTTRFMNRMKNGVNLFVCCRKRIFAKDKLTSEYLRSDKSCGHINVKMLDSLQNFFFFNIGMPGKVPSPVPKTGNILMKRQDGKVCAFNGSSNTKKTLLCKIGGCCLHHH